MHWGGSVFPQDYLVPSNPFIAVLLVSLVRFSQDTNSLAYVLFHLQNNALKLTRDFPLWGASWSLRLVDQMIAIFVEASGALGLFVFLKIRQRQGGLELGLEIRRLLAPITVVIFNVVRQQGQTIPGGQGATQ